MNKYTYMWGPLPEDKVIYNFEKGLAIPFSGECENPFLEAFFINGNFIISNRFSENEKIVYQQYYLDSEDNIIKGQKWDDGLYRTFTLGEDESLQVSECSFDQNPYYVNNQENNKVKVLNK